MAFKEVSKAPTQRDVGSLKRRYRKANKRYNDLRQKFSYHVASEDFELLNVDDFLELKEAYIIQKSLYWQIYELENPEDAATKEAYHFLNSMSFDDQVEFLQTHGLTTHRLIDEIKKNPNYLNEVTA